MNEEQTEQQKINDELKVLAREYGTKIIMCALPWVQRQIGDKQESFLSGAEAYRKIIVKRIEGICSDEEMKMLINEIMQLK